MTPAQIAYLIIEVGWPMTERLMDLWQNGGNQAVTPQEWQQLRDKVANRRFADIVGDAPND